MDPRKFSQEEQKSLIKTLNIYFPHNNAQIAWENAAPLLAMLATDRDIAKKLKENYQLLSEPSAIIKNLNTIANRFTQKGILEEGKIANPYFYRLPIIMGEYPRHTKKINHAIKAFNQIIEGYHQASKRDMSVTLNGEKLNQCFQDIVSKIAEYGQFCFLDSLTDLINMMHGFSNIDMHFEQNELLSNPIEEKKSYPVKSKKKHKPHIQITASKEENISGSENPFIEQSIYAINRAGRLVSESSKLVVNGFGLKFGGHFDGLLTHTPTLIQVGDLYSVLWRELSQRMELPPERSEDAIKLKIVLLWTLQSLSMVIESTAEIEEPNDYYMSPFSTEPEAFMTPVAIKKRLNDAIKAQKCTFTKEELLTLSDYLSQVIFRMQFNISESLGIGANDDDTVSFSNDGRDYIYQFHQDESAWASRFAHISLHRQGPAQPHMNAMKGVQHELAAALITETKRMNELQRSEYEETVYHALIDNVVTDLFPHPDFFENKDPKYKKYRKLYILTKNESDETQLVSYQEESTTGIFKEDGKTMPRFRRAGTIDVHALPKDHSEISTGSKSFNSRNPLAAKQFQYAQALQGGIRGDYMYNPVGLDGFIADSFNGQVIKYNDGSFVPFIGIIPKNFDKAFKLPTELCASFVIRMLHSSRLMSHCPTFRLNYDKMKACFLPKKEMIPDLPEILRDSLFLQEKLQALKNSLDKKTEDLSFRESEKILAALFKNIIYQLRERGSEDDIFLIPYHHLMKNPHFLQTLSRDNFEKIIRVLKINAPTKDNLANKAFMTKAFYLEKLIHAFYPKPSKKTARKIQQQAKAYQKPLTNHADLQDYFKKLSENPRANFSRQQSPGMIFMKLRDDTAKEKRTLAQKRADFDRMHDKNFLSGYRDPEGSLVLKPTNVDELLDFAAKGVAKFSIGVQDNSNPLGQIITAPFIGAYLGAKNSYLHNDHATSRVYLVPLRFTAGLVSGTLESGIKVVSYGLKFIAHPAVRANDAIVYCTSKMDTSRITGKVSMAGIFVPALFGFLVGTIESIGKLLYDCTLAPINDGLEFCRKFSKDKKSSPFNEHPLYLHATPDNEPGFKVRMSNEVRDALLLPPAKGILIKKLKRFVREIITIAYPNIIGREREIIADHLISASILTDKQWKVFYSYFDRDTELEKLLNKNRNTINTSLLSAAYRCFLERSSERTRFKKIGERYKLLPEQVWTLKTLAEFYYQHPTEQENIITYFSEEGKIRKKLDKIDRYSQKLHDAVMQAFYLKNHMHIFTYDKNKMKEDLQKAYKTIAALQVEMKELKEDSSGTFEIDLVEINENIVQLNHLIKKYETQIAFLSILNTKVVEENQAVLSIKDKAHLKWKLFATRELTHKFLSQQDIDVIFKIFETIPALQKTIMNSKLTQFKTYTLLLMQLCSSTHVDIFYESYLQLKIAIQLTLKIEQYPENLLPLLEDFVNVTMNTALNKTLDIMDGKEVINPLTQSKAIGAWLRVAHERKSDFNSLLSQQLDQPFLHLTILRQAYIIHALETYMQITRPNERIRKTGLQRLLRMHYVENNAIKKNGMPHYEKRDIDDFEPYLKTHGIFGPTFCYADARVKIKSQTIVRIKKGA